MVVLVFIKLELPHAGQERPSSVTVMDWDGESRTVQKDATHGIIYLHRTADQKPKNISGNKLPLI